MREISLYIFRKQIRHYESKTEYFNKKQARQINAWPVLNGGL